MNIKYNFNLLIKRLNLGEVDSPKVEPKIFNILGYILNLRKQIMAFKIKIKFLIIINYLL